MKWHVTRWAVLTAAALCAACTGGDKILSGSSKIVIEFEAASTPGRYDSAPVRFSSVSVLPADPASQQVLSGIPLNMFGTPVTLDLAAAGATASPQMNVALGPGRYVVSSISMLRPSLTDNDPLVPTACIDGFATLPTPALIPSIDEPATITTFAQPLEFDVPASGLKTLKLRVDGAKFAKAFEDGFLCINTAGPSCAAPPCLLDFNDATFAAGLADAFSAQ